MASYYYDTCLNTRNDCPSNTVSSCSHSEDITIECSKFYNMLVLSYWFGITSYSSYIIN